MANEMKLDIRNYKDVENWTIAAAESIIMNIKMMYSLQDEVNLLLSGGSTPGPIYKILDQDLGSFKRLTIGLVDERFVPTNHEHSNEKLIKKCFDSRPAEEYNIVGMVKDAENEWENLKLVREAYAPFKNRTDIIVLGMGDDGHTASIFPNDLESDEVITNGQIDIFSTKAPVTPTNRITCSMDLICNARHIYLLISGQEKLGVLKGDYQYPIHTVLEKRPDVQIYYLEK